MEIKPQSGDLLKGVRSESYNCTLAEVDQTTFPKHGTPLKRMDVRLSTLSYPWNFVVTDMKTTLQTLTIELHLF